MTISSGTSLVKGRLDVRFHEAFQLVRRSPSSREVIQHAAPNLGSGGGWFLHPALGEDRARLPEMAPTGV